MGLYLRTQGVIEDLLALVEDPPERNCSCRCHISPPCSDCVDWSHIREVRFNAKEVLQQLQAANLINPQ